MAVKDIQKKIVVIQKTTKNQNKVNWIIHHICNSACICASII